MQVTVEMQKQMKKRAMVIIQLMKILQVEILESLNSLNLNQWLPIQKIN